MRRRRRCVAERVQARRNSDVLGANASDNPAKQGGARASSERQEERERGCSAEEPTERNYSRPAAPYRTSPKLAEVEPRLRQSSAERMAEMLRPIQASQPSWPLSASSPASFCNTADHRIHFLYEVAGHALSAHASDIANLDSALTPPWSSRERSDY